MKKASLYLLCMALFLSLFHVGAFADSSKLKESVDEVVGTPYKWGGTTTKGFDCSGFIHYIFNQFDVKLPRTSLAMSKSGEKVEKEDLHPGDLVFFNTNGKGVSHAGIYLGEGKFAHSSSNKGVTISKLSDKYYKERYVTARRVAFGKSYEYMMDMTHEDQDDVPVE